MAKTGREIKTSERKALNSMVGEVLSGLLRREAGLPRASMRMFDGLVGNISTNERILTEGDYE